MSAREPTINAAHHRLKAEPQTQSASEPLGSRARPDQQVPAGVRVVNGRQAVVAVMAANGRTNRQISIRLRIPVRAVEMYLDQALEVLRMTSQEDLTYPAVAAHLASTGADPILNPRSTLGQGAPTSPHSTPVPVPVPVPVPTTIGAEPGGAPSPVSGRVPTPVRVQMPLPFSEVGVGASDRPSGGIGADPVREVIEAQVHGPPPEHDTRDTPEADAVLGRAMTTSFELLGRECTSAENLREAVHRRDVIGQAKGILMERYKISSDVAFAILQDESSRTSRDLVDVAAQFTCTE